MEHFLNSWRPRVLGLLRIVTAFLYMQHGTQKILGWPVAQRYGFELFSLSGVSGMLEMVGGFLVLIGLFTRPAALVLSGHMAFAYFIAHASKGLWPLANRGELAIMFCFVFFYLAFAGAGAWSVDSRRRSR